MADFNSVLSTLTTEYKKDTDQDFPINKIRFLVDFLWNGVIEKALSNEQKASLKQLIDLLNSLDDHKLSRNREMIQNLSPQLAPLMQVYPSLGHSFSIIFTTIIPSYQRYLTSLETMVKDSHHFTEDEVLLYYDMTLVDHIVLSHIFESEQDVNLIEMIECIKVLIIINALTHDYLQDTLGRSISLFTFLQRGGLAKEKCLEFYTGIVERLITSLKEQVTNPKAIDTVVYLSAQITQLATQAATEAGKQKPTEQNDQEELEKLQKLLSESGNPTPQENPVVPPPVQEAVFPPQETQPQEVMPTETTGNGTQSAN